MKKPLLSCLLILFMGMYAKSQNIVPNGNFENWEVTPYEEPSNYFSNNKDVLQEYGSPVCIKVPGQTPGTFAAQLITVGDQVAMVGNYQPQSPPPWHGGFPYTEQPTGLSGYYKSDIPPGDSAIIIANFSNSGITIGTYMMKISGTQSIFTPFTMIFNPSLAVAPDSVIVFFVSSDALIDTAVDGSTITLDGLNFTGVATQPALLNGDFENWDPFSLNSPDAWYIDNDSSKQTTDSYSGDYAIHLETMEMYGDVYGYMSTTHYSESLDEMVGGSPFINQVDTLFGYYKYFPQGTDTATVSLGFKKDGIDIGWTGTYLFAESNYTYFEIPINLFSDPDSVMINLMSSGNNADNSNIGSYLIIDSLGFKSYYNVGIITQPQSISVCEDDTAIFSVVATGLNLEYQWQFDGVDIPGATSDTLKVTGVAQSDAGDYSCVITGEFESATSASGTLTVPNPPAITITTTDVTSCGGSDGEISVMEGGYSYQWDANTGDQTSQTATGLQAGVYYVTVDNGQCTNTGFGTVNETGAPTVTATAVDTTICNGSSTEITASGADTYIWTPATGLNTTTNAVVIASPTSTTAYTVQGTTTGCSAFEVIEITVNPIPVVIATAVDATICEGSSTEIIATGADTYTWTPATGLNTTTNDTVVASPTSTETYSVEGNTAGCTSSVDVIITVNVCGGINNKSGINVLIFPNPTTGIVNIETSLVEQYEIQILDMTGRILNTKVVEGNNTSINTQDYQSGMYVIRIISNNQIFTESIIKE